ncbi:MAG: hypothetical protein IJ464_01990 [Alistipes sp.]|nr:hypothetical protein [Alistipes sp.]
MKRVSFIIALLATIATVSCEEVINGPIEDKPWIEFKEDQMTVPAEGGEFYVMVSSTGVDHTHAEGHMVEDENGNLIPADDWIEVVKVINDYNAATESTRALPHLESAIVIKVQPNDTGYNRNATLSANSFSKSDNIIIRQSSK